MTDTPESFAALQIRFAPEIRRRADALAAAIDRIADPPDRAGVERALDAAHRLKGSARTIACEGVADSAERVEQALTAPGGPDLRAAGDAAQQAVREGEDFRPVPDDGSARSVGTPAPAADVTCDPLLELVVVSIDDDEASAGLLELVIGQHPGVRLLAATTGEEGLALVGLRQPALVLLDLRLPDCDGASLIPRLRAAAPGARIVVLSGDATREIELRAAGVADVMQKPVSLDRMRSLVSIPTDV